MRDHDLGRLRPLDGDQGAVVQHGQLGVARQMLGPEGEVLVLVAGVDHDEQAIMVRLARHQIVDDPALGVQQQRILLLAGLQQVIVAWHEALELVDGVGAGDLALAHVRHVEQASVLARPAVFGQDAFVLHRHVIAAEPDHAGAQRAVRGIENGRLQRFMGHADQTFRVAFRCGKLRRPRAPAVWEA